MTKQLPSYERIFGEIDFKKGDEARSVYSPAAYLADLLQLLDDEFKEHKFDDRRSDIKEILLDAKNTFDMLPYLDRVNEILASKIKKDGNGEAFEQIRKAVYPFNLPQDIDYATVKVYLQHLGVKAEELYRLLDEMPQQELLAKAYLGILEQEWATLIETPRSGEKLAKCYGVADLSELKAKVKDKDDKDKDVIVVIVDKFLKATKISELELRELLFQNLNKNSEKLQDANFFCNDAQKGAADLTDDEERIKWKSEDSTSQAQGLDLWLDRANRFIRLAKKIGFTFTELDIVLRSCCKNELDAEALTHIAVIHWLKKKLELEVDEICAFFNQMNILGQGNEKMPIDLFNRVYNNPCAIADKQYIWNHKNEAQQFKDADLSKFIFNKDNKDVIDLSNDSYRKRIAHSLDLSTKQLTYLIKKFRSHFDNDQLWNTGDEERSMLTTFYRVSKLANICEISLEELFIIFDVLEKDPAVRQFKNCHVLIDFKIDKRDCYQIISNDNKDKDDNVQDSMWLIQVVYGLSQWMQKNDFSAHDLLKITSGDYVDKIELNKIDDTMPVKKVKTQKEIDDQEKLALFNSWHQAFKPLHFKDSLLKEAGLESRTARLVHQALSDPKYHLTKKEPRLISFDANLVKKAAIDAVNKIDTITETDFLGLGIGEKIADKIYDNLLHKGHLNTQGRLIEDQLTTDVNKFHIDTEFTPIRSELFNQISKLHQDHEDISIYPSDLKPLGLQEFESRELYQNLIFNGYIDDQGTLVEKSFFEDADNEEDFEVNANIGIQSKDVFEILSKRSQEIKLHKIAVNKGIFSELGLTDLEVDDLIENLKFNEYIDEDGHFVDNLKLTQLKLKDFSLALQFYPHRTAILSALKQHIEKNLSSYLTFSRENFLKVAEKIVARWSFLAVEHHFLEGGKIAEKHKAFFREEENSQNFDIWWSFEPTDNQMVFNTLRNIVLMSDKLQLVNDPLDRLGFSHDGKTYLFKNNQFVSSEDLTQAQSILAKWGRTQNNLKTTGKVDAAYIHGSQMMIFCGNQIFSFDDCLENEGVMPTEGFPKLIKEQFNKLPAEFHQDIEAAFKDNNQVLHLFKDKKYITVDSDGDPNNPVEIKEKWGKNLNPITNGKVDAAFVGLDGKTYLFSGTQYFRYSSDDYSEVDAGYPRSIETDWGGLQYVNAAFVLDGKTYLFGVADFRYDFCLLAIAQLLNEQYFRLFGLYFHLLIQQRQQNYIRYSTNDYKEQDQGYPKPVDNNWWTLPQSLINAWHLPQNLIDAGFAAVDAVFTDYNGNHYLFSGNQFIYSGDMHRWWSEPQTISDKWDDITFTQLDAAFTGKDGKTYFFKDQEYVRFSDKDFCHLDNGYPRTINKFWGNIKNNILETGKIDAAVRLHSEWEEEVKGQTETQKQSAIHTYLFSGSQFFRYTDDNYDHVESGYPKSIKDSLADELRFKNLKEDKESLAFIEKLSATFAYQRNIYVFADQQLRVISNSKSKIYDKFTDSTSKINCAFIEDGSVYIRSQKEGWQHSTSLEGVTRNGVTRNGQKKEPELFTKLSNDFKSGIDAVLKGTDGNTYLFKGHQVYNRLLDETRDIKEEWGRVANRIYESGQLDAGLVGRDGKTYLFSGDQFFTYEDNQLLTYDQNNEPVGKIASELPEIIKEKWGGLTRVAHAYVLDGKTYLLEPPNEDGEFRYVCYSSNDYTEPDTENPMQADQSFWKIPQDYQEEGFDRVDAVYVDGDNLILIHKGQFLEHNPENDYWSYPKSLEQLWDGIACDNHVIEELTTVFVDKTGAIHCFNPECFLTITPDSTNPGSFKIGDIHRIRNHWGLVKNVLENKVDAAVVDPKGITYLFSGDQYVRYSSDDYRQIDQDYPKSIAINLRKEASFTHLPDEFEEKIAEPQAKLAAVVINQRNVYLVMETTLFVASTELAANYDVNKLACGEQTFLANGKIDAAIAFIDSSDKNNKKSYTYLFSGNRFIRYSGDEYEYIDSGYPKTIASGLLNELGLFESTLTDVPVELIDGIDAALIDKEEKVNLIKG